MRIMAAVRTMDLTTITTTIGTITIIGGERRGPDLRAFFLASTNFDWANKGRVSSGFQARKKVDIRTSLFFALQKIHGRKMELVSGSRFTH
jgi:hypothetical protein